MRATSSRALARVLALGTAIAFAPAALAGDPKPAPKPPPVMASDADAAAAVAEFKEAFKAKGLKGDDRTSQRDFAMATLAKLQHPLVVEALAPVSRESDPMVRMLATIYLGDQTLMPGLAGKHVAAAWKRGVSDDVYVMTAMQSIARLRYLGARDDIRGALKSQNFAVKKTAIGTIVMTGDLRLVRDMLALVGVQVPSNQGAGAAAAGTGPASEGKGDPKVGSGGSEQTTEGYSWEGAEAVVDYGMSDNTQENAEAEAKVKEQIEKNKAAAEGSAGGGKQGPTAGGGGESGGGSSGGGAGGAVGGGSDGGSAPGRGGGGRSNSELIPFVLGALQKLTGQTFTGPAQFKKWWADNAVVVSEKMKKLDDKEKFQREEAAAQVK